MATDLDDLLQAGAAAQRDALDRGEVSARELTTASLRRIEALDPALNAFRVVLADEALAAAEAADARRQAGESGPLLGVPIAIKDDTEQRGQTTMFGTSAPDTPAAADSEVLRRLRAAGAVPVGRTNTPELLIWPFTETPTYGVTRNPWNLQRTPGGSSGGSAAAVAAGMVGLALGSDGGGSIRIPAACCGLYGVKTTRGLVPIAPHSDTDHGWQGLGVYGPLGRTVADAALFLDACAAPPAEGSYLDAARRPPSALRVGVSTATPLPAPVSAEAKESVRRTAEVLRSLGHTVVPVSPSYLRVLANFLVRYFTGIARSADALPHHERFEPRTRRMAAMGRRMPGALVQRSRRNEARVSAALMRVFDEVDVLLTPALSRPAVEVGRWQGQGALRTFNGVAQWTPFTAPWNATGAPAAAVPVGLSKDGLPLAVQLVGRLGADPLLLSLSAQLEAAQPWAHRRAPIEPLGTTKTTRTA